MDKEEKSVLKEMSKYEIKALTFWASLVITKDEDVSDLVAKLFDGRGEDKHVFFHSRRTL